MDTKNISTTLTKQEQDFCDLLVYGCDPYAGNARKCYEDIFHVTGKASMKEAKELMARPDVKEYLDNARQVANYQATEIKARITEKLLHIMDETSKAEYYDSRGNALSVAPLRSVAVQASKALMDLYPVKVAQESKLELNGNGDGGIVFNVIVPQENKAENG